MTLSEFLQARIADDEGIRVAVTQDILLAIERQKEDDDGHAWIVGSGVLLRALARMYEDHPDYLAAMEG